ncbi:MAG TPA: NAD-dependent epimerase/dehydratase family protein, partial [Verrucomicrobiota bacterium]|nr:NAD-dependent epimerase/dehydratase family protein [Verrucomicrobiota bacterium]
MPPVAERNLKFLVTGATGFIGWRVVRNLLRRGISVVAAEWRPDPAVAARLAGAQMVELDVSDADSVAALFREHPGITHCIHLAYLMSAEVEADPPLGARVNVLGMINLFEAAARHRLERLVFASSETVYGASQEPYGDRDVTENDFCGPQHHTFTYGVMKILNEFTAQKYVRKHGISIACARPPVVFGYGRKRGSVLWAEDFATLPALGKPVTLPFPARTRDCWIYVDDCAEQFVRLALKPELAHFAYNSGGTSVTAAELASLVRRWLPAARIDFDESKPTTPLIDRMDGSRLEREIGTPVFLRTTQGVTLTE